MSETIGALLREAAERLAGGSDSPRLDAEILLAHATRQARTWLLAHAGDGAAPETRARFRELLERRLRGEPVAYLTGEREFWSRRFHVGQEVLIPRPETEHLVETALELLAPDAASRIADLGTGSGAIAVTLALERPRCRVLATDLSPPALAIAAENARLLGAANVEFRHSDWFSALGGERFALIASNPPYVAAGDPHLERGDVRFEPALALASGDDGLAAIRALVAGARYHLEAGGWLLLEHGWEQADAVARLLQEHGYTAVACREDLAGIARVALGRYTP
jgi:release factor glutamine methyltransferase